MLDLAEEELNTVLNETNENLTGREENSADVLRLSKTDSSGHKAIQFQFGDDVSGKSIIKGSDKVILAMEASHVWPHKRQPLDDEPECYTGVYKTITLKHAGLITYPECREVARFTACSSSMANSGNKRKCAPSNYVAYDNKPIPTKCSCASWTDEPRFKFNTASEHADIYIIYRLIFIYLFIIVTL